MTVEQELAFLRRNMTDEGIEEYMSTPQIIPIEIVEED